MTETTTRSVISNRRRMVWQEFGAGEAVLMLHSGGLSGRQWRRLAESLSTQFRVVLPDLLGYGASDPWPTGEPFHFDQDLEALELLLRELASPVHLVGHSYGGLLALKLMLAAPERFGRAAFFEPVAFGVLHGGEDDDIMDGVSDVRMTYEPDEESGADEVWLRAFVEWWNGKGAWDALSEEVRATFRRSSWKLYQEVVSLLGDRTPLSAYQALHHPTLLLGAERSPMPEQRVLVRLSEAMPDARLHVFERMGHMAPLTNAAVVNEAIERFLTS